MEEIKVGLVGEKSVVVGPELTASHLGSGDSEVFSTPSLIALMENAAMRAIDPLLPAGKASVGTAVAIRHLAATPVGMQVTARAEVIEVDRRRVEFRVEARDEVEVIGEGTHTRFIIDKGSFLEKVAAKQPRK